MGLMGEAMIVGLTCGVGDGLAGVIPVGRHRQPKPRVGRTIATRRKHFFIYKTVTMGCVARGQVDILNRITVLRAFTCYQVLSELESMLATQSPFVVLDLLNMFYDESVQIGERKQLRRSCVAHLERLVGPSAHFLGGGGLVSVHPPAVPSQAAVELLGFLQASAADTFFVQPTAPA